MVSIGTAAGNLIAGLYIRRFGRLKDILISSMVLLLAGVIVIRLRWNGSETVVEATFEILVCGISNGIIIGTLLVGLLKSVDTAGKARRYSQTSTANSCVEKASIYGALHLCTAVANLVALSVITAVTQSRSRRYMAAALRDKNAENIPEVCVRRILASLC